MRIDWKGWLILLFYIAVAILIVHLSVKIGIQLIEWLDKILP